MYGTENNVQGRNVQGLLRDTMLMLVLIASARNDVTIYNAYYLGAFEPDDSYKISTLRDDL